MSNQLVKGMGDGDMELAGNLVITDTDGKTALATLSTAGVATLTVSPVIPTGTPASATAAGTAGTIKWDASYLYVCTATNTWTRAALNTW